MIRRWLLTFCTLLAIGSALPGAAFGANLLSKVIGGPGGAVFADYCRLNDLMIGFNYTAGKALNTFAAVCQSQKNGVLTGTAYGGRTWGAAAENGVEGDVRCPGGQAVRGLSVFLDNNQDIHHLRTTCGPLLPNTGQSVYLPATRTVGGQAVPTSSSAGCPSGSIAVGVQGRYGALIDAIGLICSTFSFHQSPAPTPPLNDPNRPVKCTGVQTPTSKCPYPPNQPTQDTRTAHVASTVYDARGGNDVDYLNPGDRVTIVSCDDPAGMEWCQISAPVKGYVWGEDLNP